MFWKDTFTYLLLFMSQEDSLKWHIGIFFFYSKIILKLVWPHFIYYTHWFCLRIFHEEKFKHNTNLMYLLKSTKFNQFQFIFDHCPLSYYCAFCYELYSFISLQWSMHMIIMARWNILIDEAIWINFTSCINWLQCLMPCVIRLQVPQPPSPWSFHHLCPL